MDSCLPLLAYWCEWPPHFPASSVVSLQAGADVCTNVGMCVVCCIQGEYERLQSRLPHFRFAPLKTQGDDQEPDSIEVYIHSTSESPLEPRLAHLDLVRAMRFDSSETERSVVLRLDGTSSDDPHVSDVLRALPHWNCTLGIEEPNWLLEPPCAENRLRVPLIPTTFHTWVLPAFPDSAADDVSAVLRAVVRDALGSEGGFPSLIDGCV